MPEYEVSKFGGVENALRKIAKDRENEFTLRVCKEKYHEKRTTKRKKDKAAAEKRAKKRVEKEEMIQKTFTLSYKIMQARQGKRDFGRPGKRRFTPRPVEKSTDSEQAKA